MNSYTDTSIAHAELLLITCLEKKTLREIKTSSLQYIICKVPYCLWYLKTMPKSFLHSGEGVGRAIKRVPGLPELSQDLSLHHPFSGFSLSISRPKQP
jgi:hypothetical protein